MMTVEINARFIIRDVPQEEQHITSIYIKTTRDGAPKSIFEYLEPGIRGRREMHTSLKFPVNV